MIMKTEQNILFEDNLCSIELCLTKFWAETQKN